MKYASIFFAAVVISCSGGTKEQSEATSEEQQLSGEQSCLADKTDQATWYPKSSVATLVNQPEENINQKMNEQFATCQYNWKTDRTHVMKFGNSEMNVPSKNVIGFRIINLDDAIEKAERMHKNKKFTYTEYFKSYHTQASEEDMKKVNESLDKSAEEDASAKTAKSLLALSKTENFTVLDNLGDQANYYVQIGPGLRETLLTVRHGNVALLVNVDISDEDADDLAAAKSVAEALIGLCD